MRRRWLLKRAAANPPKKDFNDCAFPLLTADAAEPSLPSYVGVDVGHRILELPGPMPAGLAALASAAPAHSPKFGVLIEFSSVWWADGSTLSFWGWNTPIESIHEIKFSSEVVTAVSAGPRLPPKLIYMIPDLQSVDSHFAVLEQRAAPKPEDVYLSILVVTKDEGVREVALRGHERFGINDSEPRKVCVRLGAPTETLSAAFYHADADRVFFATTKGDVLEYKPYALEEVYIVARPRNIDSTDELPDKSTWRTYFGLDLFVEGCSKVANSVKSFGSRRRLVNSIQLHPTLTKLTKRNWLGQSNVNISYIADFCEGLDDLVLLYSSDFTIYAMNLQPPLVQLHSENVLRVSQRPTILHSTPVMTWQDFTRSLFDRLDIFVGNASNAEKLLNKRMSSELRRHPDLHLVSVTPLGGGAFELLLNDGTRARCLSAHAQRMGRWNGRSEDTGKCIHESLRPRSDQYVWSQLQMGPSGRVEVLPLVNEPQTLLVHHVRWPPQSVCEDSWLYNQLSRIAGPLLQSPVSDETGVVQTISFAASSGGLRKNSSPTTSGCWVAFRSAGGADDTGSVVMLNWRQWDTLHRGSRLLACARSQIPGKYKKLTYPDSMLWNVSRRVELAALMVSQVPKYKSLPPLIVSACSFFGTEGDPQLSLVRSSALGGIIGLTSGSIFGCRMSSYSEQLRDLLPSLQSLIDTIFKDLNFSLPFVPHHGIRIQDPRQLVAALEKCATLPLNGLEAWAEFASKPQLCITHADFTSSLARCVVPPHAAWLLYADETPRSIDMCWHLLANSQIETRTTPVESALRKCSAPARLAQPTTYATGPLSPEERTHESCCRLLFCLTSLTRLRDNSGGYGNATAESESVLSFRRYILQLIADFSKQPIFEISNLSNGVLIASADDDDVEGYHLEMKRQGGNKGQSPKRQNRKRTRQERDAIPEVPSSAPLALTSRLSAGDYYLGLQACQSLNQAVEAYDIFIKSHVSLDVRNLVNEDPTYFTEVTQVLDILMQLFRFMNLLAESIAERQEQITASRAENAVIVLPETHTHMVAKVPVELGLLSDLAQVSFASLASNVLLERENNVLHRWFLEGSLIRLVSPKTMEKQCPDLFDPFTLQWESAIEPMKCLADIFDAEYHDRQRQQAERVGAAPSSKVTALYSNLPGNAALPAEVGALEYLFRVWESECEDDEQLIRDLDVALPLPTFVRDPHQSGPPSEVFNIAVGDGIRQEARVHALKTLQTLGVLCRDKGEAYKDAMFMQLLEILFKIHSYDFLHLSLATWVDLLTRNHVWSARGPVNFANDESLSQNDLPPKIAALLHRYLDRLLAVVHKTDRILGWDLLMALIRELTCCEIPVFSNEVDSFATSHQIYERPIAHCVFKWMMNAESPELSLSSMIMSLKSPHIDSWLDVQNQRNDVRTAQKLSTAVSEVYLSQKNYVQALSQLITTLESQPQWLELPVRVSMLSSIRIPPEVADLSLSCTGSTLSCSRGICSPQVVSDLRSAFRLRLPGNYIESAGRKTAVDLADTIRRAGSLPIDLRIEILLKCLLLSYIPDGGVDKEVPPSMGPTGPAPKKPSASLLSSELRGIRAQSQPHTLAMDDILMNKKMLFGTCSTQLSTNPTSEQPRAASAQLNPRRPDNSSQRLRWTETRKLSPKCSQLVTRAPLATTAPLPSQALGSQRIKPASVVLLSDEELKKITKLGATQGVILDKMAECLPLPSYVSKASAGITVRRGETDRLKQAQVTLIAQWAMTQDIIEFLSFLAIDEELNTRMQALVLLIKGRNSTEEAFFRPANTRDEVLQNTVGLLAKLIHSYFQTPHALIECMLKAVIANSTLAPTNLLGVLECWSRLDERRLRVNDAYTLLPATLGHLHGDVAMCVAVANSTVAERLILAQQNNNFSLVTDMMLRFWNAYSSAFIAALGDRQNERRVLMEGSVSSSLRLLPGILWRFLNERVQESMVSGSAQAGLSQDLRLLCERKTRLNYFTCVWKDELLGEYEPYVFVYESCVRAFVWDLVGLTRSEGNAAPYETLESLCRMSMARPERIMSVLRPATHWLFAVGMTVQQELSTAEPEAPEQEGNAEFSNLAQALSLFFGTTNEPSFLEKVVKSVSHDLVYLVIWVAYMALPGFAEMFLALAGGENVPELRYLVPLVKQAIHDCSSGDVEGPSAADHPEKLFGKDFYDAGLDEIVPSLQAGAKPPAWWVESEAEVPELPLKTKTTVLDLAEALKEAVVAADVLSKDSESFRVLDILKTSLENYKYCVTVSSSGV